MSTATEAPQGPLVGVKVLDLSNLLAGPMSTMFLADFGADVYKVEHPKNGDRSRTAGNKKNGIGLIFKILNRNKKTITIDLHHEKGQELVRQLVRHVDVVVENYRTGTLENWGIGYEQLKAVNPDIIMARITGYGQTGPMARDRGLGTLGDALSGCAYMNGFADRPPLLLPFGFGDTTTAIFTAFAISMALYHRTQGGGGQYIDLGLYEGQFTLLGPHVIDYDQLGIIRERGEMANVAPRNTYQTSDGWWIALSGGTGATFERIATALGIEEVLQDDRFKDNASRLNNAAEIDAIVRDAVKAVTYEHIIKRLDETGAPVGPVLNIEQIFDHPQFRARENIVAVDDEELGPLRMQNVVPRMSGTPGKIRFAGQPLGAFNEEVFQELLGITESTLSELREAGVV